MYSIVHSLEKKMFISKWEEEQTQDLIGIIT